jgi:hypothetical protein
MSGCEHEWHYGGWGEALCRMCNEKRLAVCECGECDGSGWIDVPDPLDSTAPWCKEPCPFFAAVTDAA